MPDMRALLLKEPSQQALPVGDTTDSHMGVGRMLPAGQGPFAGLETLVAASQDTSAGDTPIMQPGNELANNGTAQAELLLQRETKGKWE
jgi:hypothetical protein